MTINIRSIIYIYINIPNADIWKQTSTCLNHSTRSFPQNRIPIISDNRRKCCPVVRKRIMWMMIIILNTTNESNYNGT